MSFIAAPLMASVAGVALQVTGQASVLPSIYVICLIIGGGLLLVSTVFGGQGDTDVDVGADVDVDADMDVDAGGDVDADVGSGVESGSDDADFGGHPAAEGALALSSWLSFRFVVYFAAVFGAFGVILTYTSDFGAATVFVVSLIAGLAVGQGAHQLVRALRRGAQDTQPVPADYLHRVARVSVAIQPPRKGEVAVQVRGSERFVPAVCQHDRDAFRVGERVVITSFEAGTVQIVSQREFEFVTDSSAGGKS